MIAGAGAAYLNGGLGKSEFLFTAVVTRVTYKGLPSYKMIGVGRILHSAWDVVHHLRGSPIFPFVALSCFGCAICDPVTAVLCLSDAASMFELLRRSRSRDAKIPGERTLLNVLTVRQGRFHRSPHQHGAQLSAFAVC